jgi:hypothetical protein
MSGILGAAELTPEEQEANDRSRPAVVALVVLALLVYAWAFTDLFALAGLPAPRALGERLGLAALPIWDARGAVACTLDVDLAVLDGSSGRLVYLGGLLVAFLVTYFAPLRWKRPAIAILGLALLEALFGARATALLSSALLAVYAAFHPTAVSAGRSAIAAGALAAIATVGPGRPLLGMTAAAGAMALGRCVFAGARRWVFPRPRATRILRLVVSQVALLATLVAVIREALGGAAVSVPFGLLLFLWQFERLIFYAGDVEDGAVPEDLPLLVFLSVFVSPPTLLLTTRGLNVGQGYAYQATSFLGADKNRLVVRGLKLWAFGFVYLVFGDVIMKAIGDAAAAALGVPVYTLFPDLLTTHLGNRAVSPVTVLASTFLSQVRWFVGKAGPIHFMVGAYRILGYDMAAHYDAPLLGTNLVSLWARFTFHYREFLGRAFYYPVFLRLNKMPLAARIVLATLAAAGAGNLVWGHAIFASVSKGLSGAAFVEMLRLWPYFVLLGAGISLTEVWLLRRGRRVHTPWRPGWRLAIDVLAAYATFQYFSLIEVFFFASKFPGHTLHDHATLFARAFGVSI